MRITYYMQEIKQLESSAADLLVPSGGYKKNTARFSDSSMLSTRSPVAH